MWHQHLFTVGAAVLKRASTDDSTTPEEPNASLPPLAWGILIPITLLFVPAFIWTSYSAKYVYTTLAIVENPTPAAYEAVSSDENDATPAAVPSADGAADEEASAAAAVGSAKPITSSIRRTHKVLRSASGWRGDYRGILLAFLIVVLSGVGNGLISAIPFVFPFIGSLIMSLALVQFSAALVHTIIRANSPAMPSVFRGGLPPFRRTFEATSVPVFLLWLASAITSGVSLVVARALGFRNFDVRFPHDVPAYSHDLIWKGLIVAIVTIMLAFILVIPANVVLVRVQASLLPPEVDTVVPFDRSFSGTVEPTVLGGRGYVLLRDAFRTVSVASWKRIVLLYVKVNLVSVAINVLYAAIVVPIVVLLSEKN